MIQPEPGPIIGPISTFFGIILDFLYNIVYAITPGELHTLGISIVLFTLVSKTLTFPLTHKSQKSMQAMQKLQPEMEKIKKKYENSKSPEDQKKMGQEISKLYSENKVSPLMGCLPMFIKFPIFMSMFHIMNQPYRFVTRLGEIYSSLADTIIASFNPDAAGIFQNPEGIVTLTQLAYGKVPQGMEISVLVPEELRRLLARLSPYEWDIFMNSITPDAAAQIQPYLDSKMATEYFIGITLVENVSFSFPAILIPVLCVIFTFLTSYLTTKNQPKPTEPTQKVQQKMMLFMMPAMMGFITFGMPAGVGVYWVTSSALQIIQQYVTGKRAKAREAAGAVS